MSRKTHIMSFINDKKCPLLDYIKKGIKTVEGRKNSPQYQQIKVGDFIIFKAKNENDVKVEVTYINKYKSLTDYINKETVEKTIPCAKDYREAKDIYNKWSTHDERKALREKYGYAFLGIGIKITE